MTALMISACGTAIKKPVDYTDPMVGTGYHGHTNPGATVPFGAVQLSPDTRALNWDACSGYHYDDSTLDGFSHTHLSGTGCCDLGDIFVRPTTNRPESGDSLYRPTLFSHNEETANPGYYKVNLKDEGITAELTATPHTGVHRYTFEQGKPAVIIFDLDHTLSGERIADAMIEYVNDSTIQGRRVTYGWVPDHHVDFTARFSRPVQNIEITNDGHAAVLEFDNDGKPLVMAVGISAVSPENAAMNLDSEVATLDFDAVKENSRKLWEDALGTITVEGGTDEQLATFYSALYHTMVAPNLMSDINGEYRNHKGEIAILPNGGKYYSTLSLWDTYRAWHPLQTLINEELVCDMINSMLSMYDDSGELPIWPLASGETGCMIGYHSTSVIADAYLKGIRCFDAEKALKAMVESSNAHRKGSDINGILGYIPCDTRGESVSCALENGYDDWCIARMAEEMGNDSIASIYYSRAQNYWNIFDGNSKFFRGKHEDGNWTFPFHTNDVSRDLTEATPWQYRFAPVHDIAGLIDLFGGQEEFENALDSLFLVESNLEGQLSDITGLIGQYAHGNEPSHHIAYLYDYIGKPWKTQEMTRRLLDEMYQATPAGICGNEDCGQMSAWYVFTSLGFYPVAPGSNEFALTTPLFKKSTIKLSNGNTLVITANNPNKNRYIKKVELNGEDIDLNYLTYSQISKGGELKFILTDTPYTNRGTSINAAPYSYSKEHRVSIPFITDDLRLFADSIELKFGCATEGAVIHYTLDGSVPDNNSPIYSVPVIIDKSSIIKAIAEKKGFENSPVLTVKATKAEYLPALKVKPDKNGINYRYYEGYWKKADDIEKDSLKDSGVITEPSISGAQRNDHFAFIFEGYINCPETGLYTFRTTSDDGSVLFIDGEKVVDNDGGHSETSVTGKVALKEGIHSFRLLYFNGYEDKCLSWDWSLPSSDTFASIPVSSLFSKN